ncbi:uracil-DNA glycosylase [Orrella daihaiensis]|nr:uracil-DNA glycosylase [Orrella daihaiensis]
MAEPTLNSPGKHGDKRSIKRIMVSRLQHGWLKAMGVDVPWIAVDKSVVDSPNTSVASDTTSAPASTPAGSQPVEQTVAQSVAALPKPVAASSPDLVEQVPGPDLATLSLMQIAQAVTACQHCGLCETRRHAVPGEGVEKPAILIVGEAPGEQEDQQGKPFVGRSGQLLENMLKAIGHGRETSVFITNVVKCRPPANRNPKDEEIAACAPYLARQMEVLAPKAILAMGRFAAQSLLKTEAPLQKLRQATHTIDLGGQSVPVVVTYHPAYLLRRPVDKRLAWEDLKRLRELLS